MAKTLEYQHLKQQVFCPKGHFWVIWGMLFLLWGSTSTYAEGEVCEPEEAMGAESLEVIAAFEEALEEGDAEAEEAEDRAIDEIITQVQAPRPLVVPTEEDRTKATEMGHLFFRHWLEIREHILVSDKMREEFNAALKDYDLDPTDPLAQTVVRSVREILRHYLRWDSPDYQKQDQSFEIADFLIQDDPALRELLNLNPEDKRSLQQIIFSDLLKNKENWGILITVGESLHNYRSLFSGLFGDMKLRDIFPEEAEKETKLLYSAYIESIYRVEKDANGHLVMTADFPRWNDVQDFRKLVLGFSSKSLGPETYAPIFQERLAKIIQELPEEQARLSFQHVLEALLFDEADVSRWEARKVLSDALHQGENNFESIRERTPIPFSRPSYFRFNSRAREHHDQHLDHYRIELGRFEDLGVYEYGIRLRSDLMAEEFEKDLAALFGESSRALQSPHLIGLHREYEELYKKLKQEVESEFTATFQGRSYQKEDYLAVPYADPRVFLPNHQRIRDEEDWDNDGNRAEYRLLKEAIWDSEAQAWFTYYPPLRSNGLPPTSFVLERGEILDKRRITEKEFSVYREIAIQNEIWRRMQERYSPGEGRIPLQEIIRQASFYNEDGFISEIETPIQRAMNTTWTDPILERERRTGSDYTDFEDEAREKYILALYLLNVGAGSYEPHAQNPTGRFEGIPMEYADLLTWSSHDLTRLAIIRRYLPNYHFGKYQQVRDRNSEGQEIYPIDLISSMSPQAGFGEAQDYQPGPLSFYERSRLGHPAQVRAPLQLEKPDPIDLQEVFLQVFEFDHLLRRAVGASVRLHYKDLLSFQETRGEILELLRQKSLLIPGPSLSALGCFEEGEKGQNLSDPIEGPMSAELFLKALSKEAEVGPRVYSFSPQDFKQKVSACLERYREDKEEMTVRLQDHFELRTNIVGLQNAYRFHQLNKLLEVIAVGGTDLPPLEDLQIAPNWTAEQIQERTNRYLDEFLENPKNITNLFEILSYDPAQFEENKLIQSYILEVHKILDWRGNGLSYFELLLNDVKQVGRVFPDVVDEGERFKKILDRNLEAMRRPNFSEWTYSEVDAALYLADRWDLDTNLFGDRERGIYDRYYNWFSEKTESGLRPRLSDQDSFELLRRASDLREGEIAAEYLWGEDWLDHFKEVANQDLEIPEVLAELREDSESIFSLLKRNQISALEYFLIYRDETHSLGVPPPLKETHQFSFAELEEISRYGVSTEEAQLERLRQIGARLFWKQYVDVYLETLDPQERRKKQREFTRRREFPPLEVIDYVKELQNFKGNKEYYSQVEMFEDLDDPADDPLDPFQQAYVGRAISQTELATRQSVVASLRNVNLFWFDFFHEQERVETVDAQKWFSSDYDPLSPELRFLQFLGLDTDNALIENALEEVRSQNMKLYSEFQNASIVFFNSGKALLERQTDDQGLSLKDFRRIQLKLNEEGDFRRRVLGRTGVGSVTHGFEVTEKEARLILEDLGIAMPKGGIQVLRDDLTEVRKLLLTSMDLFGGYSVSFAESISRYVGLEVLNEIQKDRSLRAEMATWAGRFTAEPILKERLQALQELILVTGLSEASSIFAPDLLPARLSELDDQGQVDLDGFFYGLNAILESKADRLDSTTFLGGLEVEDYQSRMQKTIDLVFRGLPDEEIFNRLRASFSGEFSTEKNLETNASKAAMQKIFPISPQGHLWTVYDQEIHYYQRTTQNKIVEAINEKIETLLLADYRRAQSGQMRFLPYRDLLTISNLHDLEDLEPSQVLDKVQPYQRQSRMRFLAELTKREDLRFYASSQRKESVQVLANEIFGQDYQALQALVGEEKLKVFEDALESLLQAKNNMNLGTFYYDGYFWSDDILNEFTAFTRARYHAFEREDLALREKRKDLKEEDISLEDQALRAKLDTVMSEPWYRLLLSQETLEAFIEATPALQKEKEEILESAALMDQRTRQARLMATIDHAISAAAGIGDLVDPEKRRKEAVETLTGELRRLLVIDQTLPVSYEQIMQALNTFTKDQLEVKYSLLTQELDARGRKDTGLWQPLSNWEVGEAATRVFPGLGYVLQDAWYMLGDGATQMVAGTYRLGPENIGFNLWRLQGQLRGKDADETIRQATDFFGETIPEHMEWADPGLAYLSKRLNSRSLSNFSETQLARDPTQIYGDVMADAVGMYFLVSNFGGASLIRTNTVKAAGRALSAPVRWPYYGVRRLPGVMPLMSRLKQKSIDAIRYGAQPASVRAVLETERRSIWQQVVGRARHVDIRANTIAETAANRARVLAQNASAEEFRAGVLAKLRHDIRNLRQRVWAGTKQILPVYGSRIVLDSLMLAGGAGVARWWAFNSNANEMGDQFGDDVFHGMQFITVLIGANVLFARFPMIKQTMHASLMNYIWTDLARNGTQSLILQSESFRDILNAVYWSDDSLRLEEREYEKYLKDYRYLNDLGMPDPDKWNELPNGEELLAQYFQDQQIKAQAISGLFLLGIIYGTPMLGRRIDQHRFEHPERYNTRETRKWYDRRNLIDTLNTAYGSSARRYYDWAVQREFEGLRMKKPLQGETPEARALEIQKMREEAMRTVQENYSSTYEQLNPDNSVIRMARDLNLKNPEQAEMIRQQAVDELILNYRRQMYEQNPADRYNPALFWYRRQLREVDMDVITERFNSAWRRGQQEADFIMRANLRQATDQTIRQEFTLLVNQISTRLKEMRDKNLESEFAEGPALLEVLREFGSLNFWMSADGQYMIRHIIIPRLKAIERGEKAYFLDFQLEGVEGNLTPSLFAKILREAPEAEKPRSPSIEGFEAAQISTKQFYRRIPLLPGNKTIWQRMMNARTRSEVVEVSVVKLSDHIEMAVFPDNTFLLIHRANPRSRWADHTVLMPEGWRVHQADGQKLVIRDESKIETEFNFRDGEVYFYEVINGRRAGPPINYFNEPGIPLTIEQYNTQVASYPGILLTSIILTQGLKPNEVTRTELAKPSSEVEIRDHIEDVKLDRALRYLQMMDGVRVSPHSSRAEIERHIQLARRTFSSDLTTVEIRSADRLRILSQMEFPRHYTTERLLETIKTSAQFDRFLTEEKLIRLENRLGERAYTQAELEAFASRIHKTVDELSSLERLFFRRAHTMRNSTTKDIEEVLGRDSIETVYRIHQFLEGMSRGGQNAIEVLDRRQIRQAYSYFGLKPGASRSEIQEAKENLDQSLLREFIRQSSPEEMQIIISRQQLQELIDIPSLDSGARVYLGIRGGAEFSVEQLQRGLLPQERSSITDTQIQKGIQESPYRDLLVVVKDRDLLRVLSLERLEEVGYGQNSPNRLGAGAGLYRQLLENQAKLELLLDP